MNLTLDTLPDWSQAPCTRPDADPDLWYPETRWAKRAADEAVRICRQECPVAAACLARTIAEERTQPPATWEGIRGGTTPDERRAALVRKKAAA